jgi:hypothetical protein
LHLQQNLETADPLFSANIRFGRARFVAGLVALVVFLVISIGTATYNLITENLTAIVMFVCVVLAVVWFVAWIRHKYDKNAPTANTTGTTLTPQVQAQLQPIDTQTLD